MRAWIDVRGIPTIGMAGAIRTAAPILIGSNEAATRIAAFSNWRCHGSCNAEAEGVARPAFRELLLDAAKARFRGTLREEITRLAQIAVDELLVDIEASLDIEEKIQRGANRAAQTIGCATRLREAVEPTKASAEPKQGRPSGRVDVAAEVIR